MRGTACIADPPSFNQSAEGARPVHAIRSGQARFEHPACMGLSLSRRHHAISVVLCHSILLFDLRRKHSFVPTAYCIAVARSGGQGQRFFSAAEGLSLTDASTAAGC